MQSALYLLLCLCFLPGTSPLHAQSTRPTRPGLLEAQRAQDRLEKQSVPPTNQRPAVDRAKLKRDADELAATAQSVPSAVDQLSRGILPKDLNDKLKRIEKLAKELRSQLSR